MSFLVGEQSLLFDESLSAVLAFERSIDSVHLYHVLLILVPFLESVHCSKTGDTLLTDDSLFTDGAHVLHHVARLDVSLQVVVVQKPVCEAVLVRTVELLAFLAMH